MTSSTPALIQGIYYVVTGLWPLFSISSFQKVTGPKTDLWLVKTIGALIFISGLAILIAVTQPVSINTNPSILVLAIGEALVLMLVDLIYVFRGRISRVYLADALAELAIIIAWILPQSGA
ncbi:MAG: hypothetical protein A2428_03945 [Bdellovibrionales bacterium RIFOXYC1_FULL_54_43]|nr:MAG: hypothetical protein A2428_03945 [Bdellovibrionales bacterium RIFOXYC1_FULL_54_43]OFZ85683.1 MAG: hypothetical protein A2603_16830 [Bdellovibrionales bacterium RIFOXYD1_FULL_55_31]